MDQKNRVAHFSRKMHYMHLVQRFGYEVTLGRVLSILGAFQLDLEPLTCGLACSKI
jgi:hypothetical protein